MDFAYYYYGHSIHTLHLQSGQTVFDIAESETTFDVLTQYIEQGAKVHPQHPLQERNTDGQDHAQRTEIESQQQETDLESQSQEQETEDDLIKVAIDLHGGCFECHQ